MKKIFLACYFSVFVLPSFFISCQNTTSKKETLQASIVFEDSIHHFGAIPLSQPTDSFDFIFSNAGNQLLVVLGVETSCHCIRVDYEHQPIKPGERSYIRVIYNGKRRETEFFDKSVRVFTNAQDCYITLRVDGMLKK